MAILLKESTSIDVRIGPFVDVGDGFTPEAAVTLTGGGDNADEAELLKANGAATVDISTNTWAAVTGCDGWYDLTLTTTDTNTVGELVVVIQNDSVHLPVYQRFYVIETAIYDALFGSASAGFDANGRVDVGSWLGTAVTTSATTSKPEVDTYSISDDATAANNAELDYDGTGYNKSASTIGTATAVTNDVGITATAVDNIWDEPLAAHTTADTPGKVVNMLTQDAVTLSTDVELGSIFGQLLDDGTAWSFDRTTDSLEAVRNWVGDGTNLTEAGGTGDHLTAIDLPNQTMDITGNLSGSVGSVTGAVGSVTGNVGGNVTGSVGSLGATAKADVNAEVVDVMKTDALTELSQAAPSATPSFEDAIMLLYMALRNKLDVTGSFKEVHNDAGTVICKKALTDDGTTYSEAEMVTGP